VYFGEGALIPNEGDSNQVVQGKKREEFTVGGENPSPPIICLDQ